MGSKSHMTLWARSHQGKLLQRLVKFAGDRHCGSGDIITLVCQMILQNHVIKG